MRLLRIDLPHHAHRLLVAPLRCYGDKWPEGGESDRHREALCSNLASSMGRMRVIPWLAGDPGDTLQRTAHAHVGLADSAIEGQGIALLQPYRLARGEMHINNA